VHDQTDSVGRLLFNVLAMVAGFEADLIWMRTREGMKVAKAKGRLRGKQPELTTSQGRHLLELIDAGTYSTAELAELFSVADRRCTELSARCAHYQSSPRGRSLIPQAPDAEPATRIRWPSLVRGGFTGHRPTGPAVPEPSALVGQDRAMLTSQVPDCVI